jgi:DNA-binding CsgD family transcriptional regulator
MSKSQSVREAEVKAMLSLVGELSELPADVDRRQDHLMKGLCAWLGAQACAAAVVRWPSDAGAFSIERFWDVGWAGERERSAFLGYIEGELGKDPMVAPLGRALHSDRAPTAVTRRRIELFADPEWYGHPNIQEVRPAARVDDCLYTVIRQPGTDLGIFLVLHRPWGDRRKFGPRDRQMLDLFHGSLGWMYARAWHPWHPPADDADSLSPRLRDVLDRLLAGDSAKQAARRLGLSTHTVKEYVQALYRRFDVNSRGELLARWIPRR